MKPTLKAPWSVEFDDHGGYDCMTAAYLVKDADGRTIVVVDCSDYYEHNDWDARHAENTEARALAERIAALGDSPTTVDLPWTDDQDLLGRGR